MPEGNGRPVVMANRKPALLRGETRDRLDYLLTQELMGTGIGRSAFILASIGFFYLMDDGWKKRFIELAKGYERDLGRDAP